MHRFGLFAQLLGYYITAVTVFYYIPCTNLLLFFSEIVLISSSEVISLFSYFTSDDLMFCSDVIITLSISNRIVEIHGLTSQNVR